MAYYAAMHKGKVLEFFGTQAKTARALGITRVSVHSWPEIIPEGAAYKLQVITRGKLKVDPALYPPRSKKSQ